MTLKTQITCPRCKLNMNWTRTSNVCPGAQNYEGLSMTFKCPKCGLKAIIKFELSAEEIMELTMRKSFKLLSQFAEKIEEFRKVYGRMPSKEEVAALAEALARSQPEGTQ